MGKAKVETAATHKLARLTYALLTLRKEYAVQG